MNDKHPHELVSGGVASSAPFPRLRTAYVRAIARAWRDPDFQRQLLDPPAQYQDLPLPSGYGVLPFLESLYGFKFPFNVKFNISTSGRPEWRQYGSPGWFAHGDEIEILLPDAPSADDLVKMGSSAKLADALALYGEWFPCMLGLPTDNATAPPDDFAEFGVITTRLLSMAWNYSEFSDKLFGTGHLVGSDKPDVRLVVRDSMGIVIHWNFKLTFTKMDWSHFWTGIDLQGPVVSPGKYKAPPRVSITVHLPQRPDSSDEAIWPIALAAYNDTGPQYPFTCA